MIYKYFVSINSKQNLLLRMSQYNRDRYEDIDAFVDSDHSDAEPVERDVIMYMKALKSYGHRDLQLELIDRLREWQTGLRNEDKLRDHLDRVILKSIRRNTNNRN